MRFTETLDTGVNFRKWLSGGGMEAKYSFAMARTPAGLRMAPPEIPLHNATSEDRRREIAGEFGSPQPQGLLFEVQFHPLGNEQPVWVKHANLDTERVVTMHFGRREAKLEFEPRNKRFRWRPATEISDRDEGDLSTGDALRVFAGVSQIAVKYYEDHRPDGIVMETREEASPSRERIYRRIAERLATEKGAMITTMPAPYYDAKQPTLVWFPKVLR